MPMKVLCLSLLLVATGCSDGGGRQETSDVRETPMTKQKEAAQAAQQHANEVFRDALVAMVVCSRGPTYDEFRKQRIALETCYEANKEFLPAVGAQFEELRVIMQACDHLFPFALKYPGQTVGPGIRAIAEEWKAMVILNPGLLSKVHLTEKQRDEDDDFYFTAGVRSGLRQTREKCEALLQAQLAVKK